MNAPVFKARSIFYHGDQAKENILNRPLAMGYAHQIPMIVHFFKNQPQAFPVHPFKLWIKGGKMVLYKLPFRIGKGHIVRHIAFTQGVVVPYYTGLKKVLVIDKFFVISSEIHIYWFARAIIASPAIGLGIFH